MRFTLVLALVGSSFLCAGCALIEDTGRNFALVTGRCIEEARERHRDRRWAEEAWAQVSQENPRSTDYAKGFKEGFTDYLYAGGNGDPPIMAPPCYRRLRYQTQEGYLAVQQWFAGYRHGAAEAQARGLREFVVGPSALHRPSAGADAVPAPWVPLPRVVAKLGQPQ